MVCLGSGLGLGLTLRLSLTLCNFISNLMDSFLVVAQWSHCQTAQKFHPAKVRRIVFICTADFGSAPEKHSEPRKQTQLDFLFSLLSESDNDFSLESFHRLQLSPSISPAVRGAENGHASVQPSDFFLCSCRPHCCCCSVGASACCRPSKAFCSQ